MNQHDRSPSIGGVRDGAGVSEPEVDSANSASGSARAAYSFAIDRPAGDSIGAGLVEALGSLLSELDESCSVVVQGRGGVMHAHVVSSSASNQGPFFGGSITFRGIGAHEESLASALRASVEGALDALETIPAQTEPVSATGELSSSIDADGGFVVEFRLTVG